MHRTRLCGKTAHCVGAPQLATDLQRVSREENVRKILIAAAIGLFATAASAEDLKIALIYGKTGPLEAYAKQTETGLRMGFEYATKGKIGRASCREREEK